MPLREQLERKLAASQRLHATPDQAAGPLLVFLIPLVCVIWATGVVAGRVQSVAHRAVWHGLHGVPVPVSAGAGAATASAGDAGGGGVVPGRVVGAGLGRYGVAVGGFLVVKRQWGPGGPAALRPEWFTASGPRRPS